MVIDEIKERFIEKIREMDPQEFWITFCAGKEEEKELCEMCSAVSEGSCALSDTGSCVFDPESPWLMKYLNAPDKDSFDYEEAIRIHRILEERPYA